MDILEEVWEMDINMSTNVVDVYVNYLRKKIDKIYENKLIHTIVLFAHYVSYFTRDSLQTKFFHRLEENARIVGEHIVQNDEYNNQIY